MASTYYEKEALQYFVENMGADPAMKGYMRSVIFNQAAIAAAPARTSASSFIGGVSTWLSEATSHDE